MKADGTRQLRWTSNSQLDVNSIPSWTSARHDIPCSETAEQQWNQTRPVQQAFLKTHSDRR